MHEPTFWILTALVDQPRHGYGIIQEAAALSGDQVRLQAGTLYAALDRLAAEGLVELDHQEVVGGRPRRYYRLTDGGAAALDAETARLARNATTASQRLSARRLGLGPAAVFEALRAAVARPTASIR
jgi:DNA-binding PadR family transcriptional regulator